MKTHKELEETKKANGAQPRARKSNDGSSKGRVRASRGAVLVSEGRSMRRKSDRLLTQRPAMPVRANEGPIEDPPTGRPG